ncbi:flagellar protein FliS [Rhodopirellula sp. P2]|nr:flagellar protein FliS [Rhodopirellula sp. P2]WDQ15238.1 flagellar protein FliS [Rhodopirellula sp. P2]
MYNTADSFVPPPMTFVGDESSVPSNEPQAHAVETPTGSAESRGESGRLSDGMDNFGRRRGDAYLESMVQTASPARLRLMVIERAVEVSRHLAHHWNSQPGKRGTNEYSLKLLELLSELLSGVTDNSVEVCRTVADLYVFLCQHLIAAEQNGDASMIDEIRLVLETEAETWRMVCAQEGTDKSPSNKRIAEVLSGSGGLNLQG